MSRLRQYKIAAAAYPIDWFEDWAAYEVKLGLWVAEAAAAGAKLLVFPEYGGMELASLLGEEGAADLEGQIDKLTEMLPEVDALHARLASAHRVHILAGSLPYRRGDSVVTNRARLFAPSGAVGVQDKQIMTPWERNDWGVAGAPPLTLFDTELGKLGVLICYDSEFPLLARALIEAGAEVLLVPSCTETLAGYWRVRVGAMARALEGQCYAVQSPTVGPAPWSPVVEVNVGAAGVYAPPDRGLPPDGVVAVGEIGRPGWVYADLDLDLLASARESGMVAGVHHWPEQNERLEHAIATETL